MVLSIPTEQQSIFLRELSNEADDLAYFNAIESSREHLSQFGDETADKYPTLMAVKEARLHQSNPGELRLGIWNKETFVGGANLTPNNYDSAKINFWLDQQHTGNGYATFAARALGKYGREKYAMVYADVAEENLAAVAVLERADYRDLAREAGRAVFALQRIAQPVDHKRSRQQEAVAIQQDLERFAELPTRREALRAKDKDNLTVFVSWGIAKKLYRCPCCSGGINIGDSHAILSRVQMSKSYSHHHLDFTCARDKILPTLTDIKIIDSQEASASAVNARSRRYRNRKR